MSKIKTEQVGVIGVDAGLCWVGDPCYVFHNDGGMPDELGKSWEDFCQTKLNDMDLSKQFKFKSGIDGMGVVVSTGFGDGVYPVYAKISDEGEFGKRVKEITIKFF